jgi:poly-gamma-glutamate synthesis protein (capsule biosynthesis protein)
VKRIFLFFVGIIFIGGIAVFEVNTSGLALFDIGQFSQLFFSRFAIFQKPGERKPVTLIFVGDIMLSRNVGYIIKTHNDPRFPFLLAASTTREADILFGNLETTISNRGADQGSEYSFRSSPSVVEGLKLAGFDVLSLANNHMYDWGPEAIEDTVTLVQSAGIATVGAGQNFLEANRPAILDRNGTRFAFLAYTPLLPPSFRAGMATPGLSLFDRDFILRTISRVRSATDIVVVSLHWGEEYQTHAAEWQKEFAHNLIAAGADFVVGHHPHVIQETEQYTTTTSSGMRSGWIFYSLGNFVFDQYFSPEVQDGLTAFVSVDGKNITDVKFRHVTISTSSQPVFRQ